MKSGNISSRIHAVLAHDCIPGPHRARHLAASCSLSESTARRLLRNQSNPTTPTLIKLGDGLGVSIEWLWLGEPNTHLRTCRIFLEQVKGISAEDTTRIIRLSNGYIAKHRKAENLMQLVESNQIGLVVAARAYCKRIQ